MRRMIMLFLLCYSAAHADENPSIACGKKLVEEPKFSKIAKKLPLGDMRDITFEMLANKKTPTQQEINLIGEWVAEHQGCFKSGLEYAQKNYHPQLVALAIETNNKILVVAASLYGKELTYGAANTRIQSLADDFRNKITALAEQINSEKIAQELTKAEVKKRQELQEEAQRRNDRNIAEQRQTEYYERQRQQQAQENAQNQSLAAQFLMNNMNNRQSTYQVQPVPVLRSSVTTNCIKNGSLISCNSN